jgi:hypothetical protein
MPLNKTLFPNPEYNSISNLITWEVDTNNKVYEFNDLSPRVIWGYGRSIEILTKNDKVTIPSENSFAVLVRDNQEEIFFEVFKNYTIEKITRFDLNQKEKGNSQYRAWLCRNLYLVRTSSRLKD